MVQQFRSEVPTQEEHSCPHKHLYTNVYLNHVYCIIIHTSQGVETTQMPIN